MHRAHVNLVKVGTFLAIDFDADEILVHQLRDLFVLERLVLHYVTPVARRIANAQQNRLVLVARLRQGIFTPGIPVDRVVRVLEKIGTGLLDKCVRIFVFAQSFSNLANVIL